MSNFAWVADTWPEVHEECARAEAYLASDPRAASIYARRVVELLVDYLYGVAALPLPYASDLAAKLNEPAFRNLVGHGVAQRMNNIRKVGNLAAHDQRPIDPATAVQVMRDLHAVVKWSMASYSTAPTVVPLQAQFDPALARNQGPLTAAEVTALLAKFDEQDAAHVARLRAKDDAHAAELAARDAELAELRALVAAKQAEQAAAGIGAAELDIDEAATRVYIDADLARAGWPLRDARDREFEVTGMPTEAGLGYVDYVLWGSNGMPLALVESKRTGKSAQVGQQQAKLYADCLERMFGTRPVIFFSNGYETWLWDDAAGYPPRQVDGFYTADELELLVSRRSLRQPLAGAAINSDTVERPYQHRAIRAVGDAFDRKQREALLVMATGSGKTRTVVALVEQLMAANWVKRVLFLADRTSLVKQAGESFKAFLPDAPLVNLLNDKTSNGRVFVSTYPTMMNAIDQLDDNGEQRFGPGFFDLVIIDEAHRSVYAKYGAIFSHFDSLLVGLTATPKDEIDHNTYRLFQLEDGVPTDAYPLDEAVADGYLVPPRGVSVGTTFLRQGISYADLSDDERDEWDALEWGDDGPPDEVGANELNQFLFNEDTVNQVLGLLMRDGYRVAGGDRIGKTIIFAKNQRHAEFIEQRFNANWPEFGGELARVITYQASYADTLIDAFKQPEKAPHIAISVDMLDTGIDVPEVVNLVFFKPIRSKSKFWQMIGRGTRLRPDLFGPGQDKTDFLVFDFCGNLEYFNQDLPGNEGSIQKSLSQALFEARLALVRGLDERATANEPGDAELRAQTAAILADIVAGIEPENVLVRPHRKALETLRMPNAWSSLTNERVEAALELAGLPSAVRDTDEFAKRFDKLILTAQLAQLNGDAPVVEQVRNAVQTLAHSLLGKLAIPAVAAEQVLLEAVAGDEWWVDVTLPMLESARRKLRSLIGFADRRSREPVYTDFADALTEAVQVELPGVSVGVDMTRFKQKASAYLRAHEDNVALHKLRRGKALTASDLAELERMLHEAGAGEGELALAREGGLGVFVRSLVGLERSAVEELFANLLAESRINLNQHRFMELVVEELTHNGVMAQARLFESPFSDFAPLGPIDLFGEAQANAILELVSEVNNSAEKIVAA